MPSPVVSATLSAAASPAASAAASPAQPVKSGWTNFLIDNFQKGGPIMWPILIVSIIAVAVVLERAFWWIGRWMRRIQNGSRKFLLRLKRATSRRLRACPAVHAIRYCE
jgi:hypothetical protein